jgi:hypothetical protein
MSVPLTLLGLLERGPSHGTELKRDSDPLGVLLADHALYRLEADLRWIDHTAARLDLLARQVRR